MFYTALLTVFINVKARYKFCTRVLEIRVKNCYETYITVNGLVRYTLFITVNNLKIMIYITFKIKDIRFFH